MPQPSSLRAGPPAARWLLMLVLPLAAAAHAADGGSLQITGAAPGTNTVEFTFTSDWPPGTSYQPQFKRDARGAWLDLPNARIEEVDAQAGLFRVSAPRFGGDSGFYRVLNSQSLPGDPAAATLDEPDPAEIVLLWNQPNSLNRIQGKVYYHEAAPPGGPVGSTFEPNPTWDFSTNILGVSTPANRQGAYDVLMSDLDGDGRVDPLTVWAAEDNNSPAENNSVFFNLTSVTTDLMFRRRNIIWSPETRIRNTPGAPVLIRVLRAHYAGETDPRIWMAWIAPDGFVHYALIELRNNLEALAFLYEGTLPLPVAAGDLNDRSGRFDIASGDFDGDGTDELAILSTENVNIAGGANNWQLNVRFVDPVVDPPFHRLDTIPPADQTLFLKGGRDSVWLFRVAGHAADFDGDGRDELAVVYETANNSSQARWYLQFLKTDVTLSSLAKVPAQAAQFDQTTGNTGYPLDIQTGEFDGDPLPELVVGWRRIQIYDIRPDLSYSGITSSSGLNPENDAQDRRFLAVANLNNDDPNYGFRDEVVAVTDQLFDGNSQRRFVVQSFTVTGDSTTFYNMVQDARLIDEISNNATRYTAIGAADFGKNGPKLGTPRRYTRTITGKPVVIVNAPPVHFDVLGGVPYDVNGMFPTADCIAGDCPFYSRYTVQSTTSIEVKTDWERGWNVGVKLEGGVELPLDVGLKAEIETKFGGRFDSFASTNTTTTIEVQVDAVADDRVYATTVNYTVWEYPVIVDDEIVTYVIAYAPDVTRQNWFGSKSIVAQNYRPYHEVGNLLSYRSATEPYPGADYVRSIDSADTFTVDSSSSYVWRLTRTTTSTTTESQTFNFSIQAKASFDIPVPWIPDVELSGGYDSTSLAANTTTLTDQQGLVARLGALDGSIAGTAYSMTPYFYWDRSGALVLDYAVDLFTGTAGQPTFWGRHYTEKSDPAFVLPWRLDPEKGFAVLNEAQRQLTREIATVPAEPRPGQEAELTARLSNFSFLSTPSSFRVHFYLGDPAAGGQRLVNTSGQDNVLVPAGIPARGKQLVKFPWRVPEFAASASLLIYCVIDGDQQLDEIHEDNNVGWNEIFIRSGP